MLPLVTHEDDPHKYKLLVNHLRAQWVALRLPQGSSDAGGSRPSAAVAGLQAEAAGEAAGLLISVAHILEVVPDDPANLGHIP